MEIFFTFDMSKYDENSRKYVHGTLHVPTGDSSYPASASSHGGANFTRVVASLNLEIARYSGTAEMYT